MKRKNPFLIGILVIVIGFLVYTIVARWEWEEYRALIYTGVYLDVAAVYWKNIGRSWKEAFFVMCVVNVVGLIIAWGIFGFVFSLPQGISKISKRLWRFIKYFRFLFRFFQWLYRKLVSKPRARLVNRIMRTLSNWRDKYSLFFIVLKYLLFFGFNVVPFSLFFTSATIVAARITKSPGGFWVILAGNLCKVYILVRGTYGLGYLFSYWFL